MRRLAQQSPALHAALLSPQGRIQHAALVFAGKQTESGERDFLLEHSAAGAERLRATLVRYRLRKKVQLEPLENELRVVAILGR